MAALSSFIVTRNDRYAHDCRDNSSCYKLAAPLNTCTTIEQRGVVRFLLAKGMAAEDIHKEMLPVYGEHCLSREAVHNLVQKFSERRTSIENLTSSRSAMCCVVPTATTRILCRTFPGTYETVG